MTLPLNLHPKKRKKKDIDRILAMRHQYSKSLELSEDFNIQDDKQIFERFTGSSSQSDVNISRNTCNRLVPVEIPHSVAHIGLVQGLKPRQRSKSADLQLYQTIESLQATPAINTFPKLSLPPSHTKNIHTLQIQPTILLSSDRQMTIPDSFAHDKPLSDYSYANGEMFYANGHINYKPTNNSRKDTNHTNQAIGYDQANSDFGYPAKPKPTLIACVSQDSYKTQQTYLTNSTTASKLTFNTAKTFSKSNLSNMKNKLKRSKENLIMKLNGSRNVSKDRDRE